MKANRPLAEVTLCISRGISPKYSNQGLTVLNQRCVRDHRIDYGLTRKTDEQETRIPFNKYIKKWDVLVNSTGVGTLGRVAQVLVNTEAITVDSHLSIVRPNLDLLCGRYFGYAIIDRESFIESLGAGATGQTELSRDRLAEVEIRFHDLPTQRKISFILSAYDDLIENNLRRIKILEEMAQLLYKEWFIKFRFPGYEKVRMVDSPMGRIPEGWEVSTIGQACLSLIDGDWIETKDQGGEDYRLLQVSNVGVGRFIETGNFRYITRATFERLHCTEVLPGQIMISRMPKPTGRAWLVTEMPWKMITSVDVAILTPDEAVLDPFLFLNILNSSEQFDIVAQQSTGTTRERITRSVLSRLPVIVPPQELQKTFSAVAEPSYQHISLLTRKNDLLRQTRDLLIPKLISGELDVSDLDIKVREEPA